MKYLHVYLLFLLAFTTVKAQNRIHANMPLLPIGIVNVAYEKPLSEKYSIQGEITVSPWKSFFDRNLQIYMISFEGKRYFLNHSKGFHVGTYLSGAKFNLQKGSVTPNAGIEYHKGYAYVIGISFGYYMPINDKLGIDFFGGVGTAQTFYKAYYKINDVRADSAKDWNKSGEIFPTRGGISLVYKL